METFASLREYKSTRLTENKDRFIQKNTLLTDEQKAEVLDFFHSHANLEAKVNKGNWNYEIPYEEFKKVMDSVDTEEKRLKKQTKELRKQTGLEGLTEGTDYVVFKDTPEYIAYKPLTHKGMRVIASNMVEPKLWCRSSLMTWSLKEVLPEGEPTKDGYYPGAKWCVAMETDKHWRNYMGDGYSFIVICRKQVDLPDSLKKICAAILEGSVDLEESVDASDTYVSENSEEENILENLLLEDPEVAFSRIQTYYDPSRKAYVIPKNSISPSVFLKISSQLNSPVIWEGDFTVPRSATSLEGCPNTVTGTFSCRYTSVTSLKGAPREVGESFTCSETLIESLEGAPEQIKGDFCCTHCGRLKSLEGAPESVGGDFTLYSCSHLLSLKGAPKEVGGIFSCSYCTSLTSLEGAPEYVGKGFWCENCWKLKSLKGAPREVKESFKCSECTNLTTLEGAPEKVGRDFDCNWCPSLTSLKGAPRRVERSFYCGNCRALTTLEGAPEYVGGIFGCSECRSLTSLKGAPKYIGGNFIH